MARAFAHHMKGNARLIIIGRNKSSADALIASLPAPANTLSSFLPCEASLMRNIDAACDQLVKRDVDKINYLVLSVGEFVGFSHEETEEGVDKNYAALFFGRFRWIRNLAPMLDRAAEAGEEAKVMSVARAGKGGPVDWNDLDGRNSLRQQRLSAPTYQDLMLQVSTARVRLFLQTPCSLAIPGLRQTTPQGCIHAFVPRAGVVAAFQTFTVPRGQAPGLSAIPTLLLPLRL